MEQVRRSALTTEQQRELWRRWRAGESLHEIARAFGRRASSIHGMIAAHGGYVPAARRRAPRVLALGEREEISRGLAAGASLRLIARRLGRAPSTVSREVARHDGRRRYRALRADERAWRRARRPKPCKLASEPRLRALVAAKLGEQWSPEQISGWLARTYAGEQALQVSTETIYRSLFVQTRGVLARELTAQLRTRRTMRRSKQASRKGGSGVIRDGLPLSARPPEVADRAVPGHWEGDLLAGSQNTHIATLVERQTRFLLLVKLDGRDSETVVAALAAQVQTLPAQLRRSLTWDRGAELAAHKRFSIATDVAVYFCDPRSPWQRGTNENTNGLLRQYFPKQTDLALHTQAELDAVAARLNGRPRKTLAFETPAARFASIVASIV
jgi:IS30 family transposase